LILVPDYLTEDMTLRQIEFPTKESCVFIAELLGQTRDPIVKKKNCVKMKIFEEN
jgi:hypothetical protein